MIRVVVKAASPAVKASLESLLRGMPALRVIDRSDALWSGAEAADVLVAEAMTLTDPAAREALERARAGGAVVLLLRHPAAGSVAQALRSGVKAVLTGGIGGPEIQAAVQAAAAGLVALEAPGVEALLQAHGTASSHASEEPVEPLTPRELEVLQLLAAGLGNKEIASRLKISDHTVKFHVASIMGKLGAESRTEAVTMGIRQGLILV
jgi:DNA-binding NarL/FixJ family response regulator